MRYGQKYTSEFLGPIVESSINVFDVMRKAGIKLSGGGHSHIKRVIKKLGLNTSHFKGRGSNSGSGKRGGCSRLLSGQVLVMNRNGGRREHIATLRRALIESGVRESCTECGLEPLWNGRFLRLEIDHIDGCFLNNLKDNLRFLCPNCHSQVPALNLNKS